MYTVSRLGNSTTVGGIRRPMGYEFPSLGAKGDSRITYLQCRSVKILQGAAASTAVDADGHVGGAARQEETKVSIAVRSASRSCDIVRFRDPRTTERPRL